MSDRLAALREQLEQLKSESSDQLANHQSQIEHLLDQVRRIDGDLRKWRGREELLVEALENNIRHARFEHLVSLDGIPELQRLLWTDDALEISMSTKTARAPMCVALGMCDPRDAIPARAYDR